MEYKALTKNSPEYPEVEAIFFEAFPAEEIDRSIGDLVSYAEQYKESKAIVAIDEGAVAGFYIVFEFEDFAVLEYLAVNSAARGKGYGTIILDHILDTYKHIDVVALIEKEDDSAANNDQRVARRRFYERNNMFVVDGEHSAQGVTYRIISNRADFDLEAKRADIVAAMVDISARI